ncbi:S1C family serine protease [Protofrankia symbiont of Coriaria ruscifolia]|uniref:S1C family serine protease n=1 Tax=Protofrankia symbiont of Coriaria ruscifolia TaxID=1306542 RepID=UPI0010413547|nr:trypsin-like peptidase domain-containing protein [Protofrankia symbiont of Coriaria ruscifolia]
MSTRPPFATFADGSSLNAHAPDDDIDGVATGRDGSDWAVPDADPYPVANAQPTQAAAGGGPLLGGPGSDRPTPPRPTTPYVSTGTGLAPADPGGSPWQRPAGPPAATPASFSAASSSGNSPFDPDRTSSGPQPYSGGPGEAPGRIWWDTPWNAPEAGVPTASGSTSGSGRGASPAPDPTRPGGPGYPGGPLGVGNPFYGPPAPPIGPYHGPTQTAGPSMPPPHRRRLVAAAIALALVSAGVGGGVGALVAGNDNSSQTVASSGGLLRNSGSSGGTSPAASDTVSAAAQAILPSVVTISVSSRSEASTGSGVIVRQDGYILTNNHVVSDASQGGSLKVTAQDGKNYDAKIVGTDPSSDLAVIKIDANGLKPATFGNSDTVAVGELVIAVGSPLGLSGTVTSGIVSAVHRPVRTGDANVQDNNAVLDAIQTDAPINPGNSGGPLVNSKGELIGINSAIATVSSSGGGFGNQQQQSGNIGVGFAIPANYAQSITEELITGGAAKHPYLGVSASTAGASQSDPTGEGTGAVIGNLVGNGPAQQAGLQPGDVITKLGNRRITSVDGLIAAVRSYAIGSKVTITYTHNGQTLTTEVTLAQQPS